MEPQPIIITNLIMLQAIWPHLTAEQKQAFVDNELTDSEGTIIVALDEELGFNISMFGMGDNYNGRANVNRVFIADNNNDGSFETTLGAEPEVGIDLPAELVRETIIETVQKRPDLFVPLLMQAFGGKMPSIKPAYVPPPPPEPEPEPTPEPTPPTPPTPDPVPPPPNPTPDPVPDPPGETPIPEPGEGEPPTPTPEPTPDPEQP